ncbi:MAG: glycerol kinase GlpK [Firmicutes bacterium]|nr:glycerol kinase GlpK [Bacillota bacterium]
MSRYIIALDQSTSASKVFLLDHQGMIVRRFNKSHEQFYPRPGYVEHDANEIWTNVIEGIAAVSQGILAADIAALSISNQRETTVVWDRETGIPVAKAIVWQDVRGTELCGTLAEHADAVTAKTGLALSPYYPAAKAASLFAELPELAERVDKGELCVGTIDSYLVYRLTNGQSFLTDVSNASRTELFNIHSLAWDSELCGWFGVAQHCLPKVISSDGDFGLTSYHGIPQGIAITGVMGDSHAALFGQGCLKPGMVKATLGTGSSVMMNVGCNVPVSNSGFSASVGFGFKGQTCYVLEGNITCSADTLVWLRNEAKMVSDINQIEKIADGLPGTEGVYLVPAFSGLGAPYFDNDARAAIVGMNRSTSSAHIISAALESIAYQEADIIAAMRQDSSETLSELRVNGGPTQNKFLMQLISDLLDCSVQCCAQSELSALGAGYMAGITTGLFSDLESIPANQLKGVVYQPVMKQTQRDALLSGWHNAVAKCLSK